MGIDPLEFLIDTLRWKLIWNPDQMKMDQIFKGGKSQFRACLHYLFTCTHLLAQAQVFHCLWTNRKQQSWTKVLTHLSKTNAFYQHPSIISKNIFFVDSQIPLSPFQCSNVLCGHCYVVTTLKRERGSKCEIGDWKTHLFNETGLFRGVSQLLLSMIVWIIFYTLWSVPSIITVPSTQ